MNLLSHTMRDHAGQASDTLRIIQKRQAARTTIVDIVVQWNMQAAAELYQDRLYKALHESLPPRSAWTAHSQQQSCMA